jgi:hypothetical protein
MRAKTTNSLAPGQAVQLRDSAQRGIVVNDASSGKKLKGWVIAAVIAWAAHPMGSTFVRMEAHMDASITLKVQSEAHGTVGPSRDAPIHANNRAFEVVSIVPGVP